MSRATKHMVQTYKNWPHCFYKLLDNNTVRGLTNLKYNSTNSKSQFNTAMHFLKVMHVSNNMFTKKNNIYGKATRKCRIGNFFYLLTRKKKTPKNMSIKVSLVQLLLIYLLGWNFKSSKWDFAPSRAAVALGSSSTHCASNVTRCRSQTDKGTLAKDRSWGRKFL